MLEDGYFDPRKPLSIRHGELPHWRQDGALYFVTFRLSDSLPQSKIKLLKKENAIWVRSHPLATSAETDAFYLDQRRKLERWLDANSGSCILSHPEARGIVEESLLHFDGERYELGAVAVAPNHVHAITRTASGTDLSDVLHSWKRHSSRQLSKVDWVQKKAPKLLGSIWQTESFDHIVRNRDSLEKFDLYIRNHKILPEG